MEELLQGKTGNCQVERMSFLRHLGFKNIYKTAVQKKLPNCLTEYSVTRRIIPNKLLSSRACFRFILQ